MYMETFGERGIVVGKPEPYRPGGPQGLLAINDAWRRRGDPEDADHVVRETFPRPVLPHASDDEEGKRNYWF